MTEAQYDKRDQYDKVASMLLQGERILAVYDCVGVGTGFVGLTDKRVVLQDNSFVGKQVALTSLPYSKITSVAFVADRSMLGKFASSSTVAIAVGTHIHEASFRGDDKARYVHDVVLHHLLS